MGRFLSSLLDRLREPQVEIYMIDASLQTPANEADNYMSIFVDHLSYCDQCSAYLTDTSLGQCTVGKAIMDIWNETLEERFA